MEIIKIIRKGFEISTIEMRVGDLDKSKCSRKFLSNKIDESVIVNVKCDEHGNLDLRGKKEEYRIIIPDETKGKFIFKDEQIESLVTIYISTFKGLSKERETSVAFGYQEGLYKAKEIQEKNALDFSEWLDINGIRNGQHEWKYKGDNFKAKYTTREMYQTWCKLD
jgi:hypothetical protein